MSAEQTSEPRIIFGNYIALANGDQIQSVPRSSLSLVVYTEACLGTIFNRRASICGVAATVGAGVAAGGDLALIVGLLYAAAASLNGRGLRAGLNDLAWRIVPTVRPPITNCVYLKASHNGGGAVCDNQRDSWRFGHRSSHMV